MIDADVFTESVFGLLKHHVHTIKPCVVEAVNYEKNTLTVLPLTSNLWRDNVATPFPSMADIPILVNSANGGSAAITFPIKKGDMCLVLFSDRNYGDLLDKSELIPAVCEDRQPFGMYPIGAIVGIFTEPNAKNCEIDPDNVVIRNGKTKITVKPDGDVDIESEATVNVSCQEANIDSPQVNMTGNLQVDGDINSGGTVTADTDVNGGGVSLKTHIHKAQGSTANTTPPL